MAALAIVGAGIQAYSAIQEGEQKKQAYEFEAQAKHQQANQVELAAEREIQSTQQRFERTRGAQISAFGRSGVQVSSGSPLAALEESAALAYGEMGAIRQAADYKKSTLAAEAGYSRILGDQAQTAGYLGAAGSVLTAVGKNPYTYDQKKPAPKAKAVE